ncbi:MAG: hypothetical protein Q7R51_00930 [bacterium]|nr:hypothetical protein [bacterium]
MANIERGLAISSYKNDMGDVIAKSIDPDRYTLKERKEIIDEVITFVGNGKPIQVHLFSRSETHIISDKTLLSMSQGSPEQRNNFEEATGERMDNCTRIMLVGKSPSSEIPLPLQFVDGELEKNPTSIKEFIENNDNFSHLDESPAGEKRETAFQELIESGTKLLPLG